MFDLGLDKITIAGQVIDLGLDRGSTIIPVLIIVVLVIVWRVIAKRKNISEKN